MVFLIGAGAFVLSYDALYTIGQTNGIPTPKAWVWPLLIDAPLIVFTLALLVAQIVRQSITLWAGLVILYTLATIGFNLSHAQPSSLGWTVAIVAPIGLLLSTEALRHLAKTIIERGVALQTLTELTAQVNEARHELTALLTTKQEELDRFTHQMDQAMAKLAQTKVEIEQARTELKAVHFQQRAVSVEEMNQARQAKIEQRRADILALLQQGMNAGTIADELQVSLSTVKRDLTALNGQTGLTL